MQNLHRILGLQLCLLILPAPAVAADDLPQSSWPSLRESTVQEWQGNGGKIYLFLRERSVTALRETGDAANFLVPEFRGFLEYAAEFLDANPDLPISNPGVADLSALELQIYNHTMASIREKSMEKAFVTSTRKCIESLLAGKRPLSYRNFWELLPQVLSAFIGRTHVQQDFYSSKFREAAELAPNFFILPTFDFAKHVPPEVFNYFRPFPVYLIEMVPYVAIADREDTLPLLFAIHDLIAHAYRSLKRHDRRLASLEGLLHPQTVLSTAEVTQERQRIRHLIQSKQDFADRVWELESPEAFGRYQKFCRTKTTCAKDLEEYRELFHMALFDVTHEFRAFPLAPKTLTQKMGQLKGKTKKTWAFIKSELMTR